MQIEQSDWEEKLLTCLMSSFSLLHYGHNHISWKVGMFNIRSITCIFCQVSVEVDEQQCYGFNEFLWRFVNKSVTFSLYVTPLCVNLQVTLKVRVAYVCTHVELFRGE